MAAATASAAKISRPKVSGVYPRMRLFAALDRLADTPVTWITSPPGAGKTTLVSHYLEERGLNTVWYQLDEDDADPPTFFHYLGLAGRRATPRKRKTLPPLTPEYQFGITTFARNFFRALFERFDGHFALVLDNFQELGDTAALHELLLTGFEQLPQGGRIFVISRAEPPAHYARVRANNRVGELTWDQIALDGDELAGVLRLKGRPELSLDRVMAVTQGWMGGLILLLHHEPAEWAADHQAEFNPKVLFDYFAGEVYDRTDTDTRKFLVKTALLTRMTAAMAAQLTGMRESGEILEQLAGRNYFMHRHTGKVTEYQYHPLFLEFLHRKTRESLTDVELTAMQWRAAEILAGSGQVQAAVDLLFKVRDWKQIGRLIGSSAESLLNQGRHQTLQRWLEQLPPEVLDADPWLRYWLAMARRTFDPDAAYPLFRDALEGFCAAGNARGAYLCWAFAARISREARNSTTTECATWDAILQELTQRFPDYPDADIEILVATTMYDIVTWALPRHRRRAYWENRFEALLPQVASPAVRMESLIIGGTCDCILGNFLRAGRLLQQAETLAESSTSAWNRSLLHLLKPFYHWRAGENEAARRAAFAALHFADETGIHIWDEHFIAHGLTGALKSSDMVHADRLAERASRILHEARGFRAAHLTYNYCWYLTRKGEAQRAQELIAQGLARARQSGSVFFCGLAMFGQANVLDALGRRDEARQALAESLQIARDNAFHASIAMCSVYAAWFALQDGDEPGACELLREGLGEARQIDFRSHGWWRDEIWGAIAAVALNHDIEPDYVRRIIRRDRLVPPEAPLDVKNWPWEVRIRCFGHCELQVNDEPVRFSRKAQKKPLQLIRALIAMGGSEVAESRIVEALWPDAEPHAAQTAFATTLHRLRSLLGADAIRHAEGRVGLDERRVWTDVRAFEQLLQKLRRRPEPDADEQRALLESALTIYRGHLLADDSDHAWVLPLREKLRGAFLQNLEDYGRLLEQQHDWDHAIRWYRRGLEADMLAEQFYQRIMYCYRQTGRLAEAVEVYRQCFRVLNAGLNVEPSRRTQELYRSLRQ
jgi:LuxR family maltose regulon positive regulatory protein